MEKKSFSENLKKTFEEIKKDKKKMFFVILIPVVLIGSIIAGIVLNGKSEQDPGATSKSDSLLIPVDSLNEDKKGKTEIYKSDFYAVEEEKEQVDIFGEEENTENSRSSKSSTENTQKRDYSYKNYNQSTSTNRTKSNYSSGSSGNGNHSTDNVIESSTKKEKRRRIPDDGSGNMSYGNSTQMYRGVVANGNQIVKSGSYVKIRVAEEIKIDGIKIDRNSIITGIAKYSNERMMIEITSIKVGTVTKKVEWVVYDEDGNLGVAVPASILNDIAKDGAGDVIEEGGSKVEANVPVVGNVKVNLKKKTTEVSFVIRDGHRLYIKTKNK